MKEMFNTIKEVYQEDRKEFWEVTISMVLWVLLTWFLLWFAGTFCYDM